MHVSTTEECYTSLNWLRLNNGYKKFSFCIERKKSIYNLLLLKHDVVLNNIVWQEFCIPSTSSCRFFACQNPRVEGGNRRALPKSFVNRFTNVC